jgi:DNA-directed RNA polymerase subunit N (RpoN/RPB10)
MIYPRCTSCGTKLAHIEIPYEKEMKKICSDPKMTDDQKDTAKQALVNSFGLTRYCCKRLLITYVDIIELIK